ncbi:MAG: redox-sensing transcriptional repressor Rex [Candidatus Gastranaerophilales bacterium]
MNKNLSDKVIHRLTLYHCILIDYINDNVEFISSSQIAKLLHIDDSQVRKDISLLNKSGKSRVGYTVKELMASIQESLGYNRKKNAYIVGAGYLGSALANYGKFSHCGLNIVAAFDNDQSKVGTMVNNIAVRDINELPEFVEKTNIDIAILTVPRVYGQIATDFLIEEAKVKYIWNFTPRILNVPAGIHVWNENLMANFIQFTYKIK